MRRWLACALTLLSLAFASATHAATPPDPSVALGHTLRVPLDYSRPQAGSAELYYEFGAPFDARKPTVILVADGQQYYVQKGSVAALQQKLFGDGVNVVGLVTRGTTPAFMSRVVGADGKPDWPQAWRLFNSSQWIEDLESLRKAVVGPAGKIDLYGRSGGAYLVHQYLSVHGDHVARAFTQSPVNPVIARDLGIRLDRFWPTLGVEDPALRPILLDALKRRPDERVRMLVTLQRQHFYVPDDQLKAERERLVHAFASGDAAVYDQMRADYEVDNVVAQSQSNDWIAQNVRVLELIGPSGAFDAPPPDEISPLIEPQRQFAGDLVDLEHAGRIPAPGFDVAALRGLKAEVFILAGRDDEAVDYRTTIALAYAYPRHALFIADDNHNFLKLAKAGGDARLIQAFYGHGLGSAELDAAIAAEEPYRWRE